MLPHTIFLGGPGAGWGDELLRENVAVKDPTPSNMKMLGFVLLYQMTPRSRNK